MSNDKPILIGKLSKAEETIDKIKEDIRKATENSIGGEVHLTIPVVGTDVEHIMEAVRHMQYKPQPTITEGELEQLRLKKFALEEDFEKGLPKGVLNTLGVDFGKSEDYTVVSAMSKTGRLMARQSGKKFDYCNNNILWRRDADIFEIQEDLQKVFEVLDALKSNTLIAELKEPVLSFQVAGYTVSVNPTAPEIDINDDIMLQIEGQKRNRAKNREQRRKQNKMKGRKRR
jgi:hypothetical protein